MLPVGLLAQLVERYTGVAGVKGLNPVQGYRLQVTGFLFATAKVATITAVTFFHIIPSLRR